MLKVHSNEILILYSKESNKGKQTVAYGHSLGDQVKDVEFHDSAISTTMWKVILGMLDKHPKDLLDKSKPYYQEHIAQRTFDSEGWLNILRHNPELIRSPIAIKGKQAILVENPADILQLK